MLNSSEKSSTRSNRGPRRAAWRSCSTIRVLVCLLVAILIIALAIGLGVGLTRGDNGKGKQDTAATPSTSGNNTVTTPPTSGNNTVVTPPTMGNQSVNSTVKLWQPDVGTTWQIELEYPLNDTSYEVDVYDIDMFDNDASMIATLQNQGRKVICYFSAGSYENWRPDAYKFKDSDLGYPLDGWPGERWLNISSSNVRQIMLSRLDLAKTKGCDGVDPDNTDGYDNDNGLGLTQDDSINFVNFLAKATHNLNMSLGLKNSGSIIPRVIGNMQWSVNEQCVQYDECITYAPFIDNGKPVFHIEYPKGDNTNDNNNVTMAQKNTACTNIDARNFSTVIKNIDLDNWIETC
ncbi:glycoside hydrolase superfamily [Lipomyces kononenkoae]